MPPVDVLKPRPRPSRPRPTPQDGVSSAYNSTGAFSAEEMSMITAAVSNTCSGMLSAQASSGLGTSGKTI